MRSIARHHENKFAVSLFWARARLLISSSVVMIGLFSFFRSHFHSHDPHNFYILAAFLGLNILVSLGALSTRVELNDTEITRKSLFGRISIPVKDIQSAEIASVPLRGGAWRKASFLILRAPDRAISFSAGDYTVISNTLAVFSKNRLIDIQKFILAAGQKQSHTIKTSDPTSTGVFIKSWKKREQAEILVNMVLIAVILTVFLSSN